jgi:hypothetical protein
LLPDGDYSADVLRGIENALAFDIYKKLSQPIKHNTQTALIFTDPLCRTDIVSGENTQNLDNAKTVRYVRRTYT